MRKGIIYTAMLLCASLSLLITSCPVYADSSTAQVVIGPAYRVTFIYEGKLCTITGRMKLFIVDKKVVKEECTELNAFIEKCKRESKPLPEMIVESEDMAEFHCNLSEKANQINEWAKKKLKDNKENNGWEDADFSFDKREISKQKDVKRNGISNIFARVINMYFG